MHMISEQSFCMHIIATEYRIIAHTHHPEAEFLDVIGTKVLRVFLLDIHSHLHLRILLPPMSKSGLKLVYNVNIDHRNLKSENSQDYDLKPQYNCTFINFRLLEYLQNTYIHAQKPEFLPHAH
jgi:hypothetical protein